MRFRARNSPFLLTFIRSPPTICDFWPYFRKLQRSYKHTWNYKSNSFTFQTCKMIRLVGFIKSTTLNCRFDPAFKLFYTMIKKFWAHLTSNWFVNSNSDILVVPCMSIPPLFYLLNDVLKIFRSLHQGTRKLDKIDNWERYFWWNLPSRSVYKFEK